MGRNKDKNHHELLLASLCLQIEFKLLLPAAAAAAAQMNPNLIIEKFYRFAFWDAWEGGNFPTPVM